MAEQANSTLMDDLKQSVGSPTDEPTEENVNTPGVPMDEPVVATITEKFAKEAGLPPQFVGKSMDELPKAIRSLQANYTQKSQALSELGKKVEQLEKTILNQAPKADQKEAKEIMEEIPDPVVDRQAFNRWLENRDKRKESELEKKIGDMFENKFGEKIKTVEDYNNKQREQQIMAGIINAVDEDTNVGELIGKWAEEMGIAGNDAEIDYWIKRPEQMIKSVTVYHNSLQMENLKRANAKETGDKAVKEIAKKINEVEKKKPTDLNSVKRNEKDTRSPLMKQLHELVEE